MVETNPEGVYYDMPASRYHAAQGVSNSMLKHLARSPGHLQAYLEQPEEQTPAMLFAKVSRILFITPCSSVRRRAGVAIVSAISPRSRMRGAFSAPPVPRWRWR